MTYQLFDALLAPLANKTIGTLLAPNDELVVHTDPQTPAVFVAVILDEEDAWLHHLQGRLSDSGERWFGDSRRFERYAFWLRCVEVHTPLVLVADDMEHHSFLEHYVILRSWDLPESRHLATCRLTDS